jgi:hypothetical protein
LTSRNSRRRESMTSGPFALVDERVSEDAGA